MPRPAARPAGPARGARRPGRSATGGEELRGRAPRRPALPLRLVRRRVADRGDGVHRDGARPRLPRAHRPLAAAQGGQRAERGAADPPARRGRGGQRAPRRAASGCSRASRSTSSTTAPSTRPTRCSPGSTYASPSVHSKLAMDAAAMTRRMVAAVRNPRTNVLGHCTGRLVTGNRGTRTAEPVRRRGGLRGLRGERRRRRDQLPPRAARPADEAAGAGPRPRLPVLDRQRRPRARAARLPRLRRARAEEAGIDPDRIVNTWPVTGLLWPGAEPGLAGWLGHGSSQPARRGGAPLARRRRTVSAYRDGDSSSC